MKNEETLLLFAKAIKSLIKTQPLDKITVIFKIHMIL